MSNGYQVPGPATLDLVREHPLPLSAVPKLPWIPRRRGGRRLHVATVHRWCTRGIRGKRLEYVQLPDGRITTEEAVLRFFQSLTKAEVPLQVQPNKQRRQEIL